MWSWFTAAKDMEAERGEHVEIGRWENVGMGDLTCSGYPLGCSIQLLSAENGETGGWEISFVVGSHRVGQYSYSQWN